MNPLEFLFNSLGSLSNETELLEACDWDEDRVVYVKECLEKSLNVILSRDSPTSISNILKEARDKMLENISEKEVDICLHIVEGLLNSPEAISGDSYEN